jgi:hypothetical protein
VKLHKLSAILTPVRLPNISRSRRKSGSYVQLNPVGSARLLTQLWRSLHNMKVSLIAGFFYFLIVGTAGVLLGTLREMFVSPVFGHGVAVVLELPLMLAIAWFFCQRLVKWCGVSDQLLLRLLMGLAAFTLLMGMEQSLSLALRTFVVAQAPQPWTVIDYIGLGAQAVFGLMPLFVKFAKPKTKMANTGDVFDKVPFPQRHSH